MQGDRDQHAKFVVEYDISIPQGAASQQAAHAGPPPSSLAAAPIKVEKGEDSSVLVLAFTGLAGKLTLPTFDFLSSAALLKYDRIMLRDDSRTCYLGGIPPAAQDFDSLIALLTQQIADLAPKHVISIGTSGGSHAAVLFGHLLRADYVHAFSPYTTMAPGQGRVDDPEDSKRYADVLEQLDRLPAAVRRYLDLREVLGKWNGKTRFNIHVCADSVRDLARANRLQGLPGVTLHRYGCNHHRVAAWLIRRHSLLPLLKIENQDKVADIVKGLQTAPGD